MSALRQGPVCFDLARWPQAGRRFLWTVFAAAAVVLGCSETPGPAEMGPEPPPPPPLPATPFIVSNPRAAAGGGSVAYVSLSPGMFEEGSTVSLHAPRASSDTTLLLADGGMDPVPLPAAVGDTLTATVNAGPTAAGQVHRMLVPGSAAPVVVRTDPQHHKLKVPLDAVIVVVFSEPVAPSSLTGAITLTRSGATVPGTIAAAPDGVPSHARFTPGVGLAPLSGYELRVRTAVRDLDGDSLGAAFLSDFTTDSADSPPPPGPPHITIVRPEPGDSQLGEFFRAAILSRSERGHSWIEERLIAQSGDTVSGWTVAWPQGLGDSVGLEFRLPLNSPPGAYSLVFLAGDSTGAIGVSAPVPVNLATPDSSPRLEVLQFFLVEIGDDSSGGYGYAPQLVVADAQGGAGVEILGFELLRISDSLGPFPTFYANRTIIPADPPTSLFGWSYGYEAYFFMWDGRRLTGPATALIAYRDSEGRLRTWTFEGAVVPLPDTLPPPAVCGRWALPGVSSYPPLGCSGSLRVVAPRPGAGSGQVLGEGTPGEVHIVPLPGRGQGRAR